MTDGVAQRALKILEDKRAIERQLQQQAAARQAKETAARIQRDSADIIPLLQNGEFADPEWEVREIIYEDHAPTQLVKGVIFVHPTLDVPDIFVDRKGRVHEAKPLNGPQFDHRIKWTWGFPLTLEQFGHIVERKREEYNEMMRHD